MKIDRQTARKVISDIIADYGWTERGKSTYDLTDGFIDALEAASPSSPVDAGAVEAAARAVIASWDARLGGEDQEQQKTYRDDDMEFKYWSPASSMVDSEAIANLRAALSAAPREGLQ